MDEKEKEEVKLAEISKQVHLVVDQEKESVELATNGGKENQESQEKQSRKQEHYERFCFACNRPLSRSRQLINISGQLQRWHPECFRCNLCQLPMDSYTSCHVYRDKIVCKEDYAKLQRESHSAKCAKCRWPIGPADWVRRAADLVYHLACFSCDICLRQLSTGEQFALSGLASANGTTSDSVRLLCRLHFAIEPTNQSQRDDCDRSMTVSPQSAPSVAFDLSYSRSPERLKPATNYLQLLGASTSDQQHQRQHEQQAQLSQTDDYNQDTTSPTDDSDTNAAQSDRSGAAGQLGRQQTHKSAHMSASSSSASLMMGAQSSKSKRVRTTFTEDQLSILQTHFQIDSNPDGQDLERIATITGLSKRVTQVWFQNSRARQKKHLIKRKPSATAQAAQAQGSSISAPIIGLPDGSSSGPSGFCQLHQLRNHHHQHQQMDSRMQSADCFRPTTKWLEVGERSELSLDEAADLDGMEDSSRISDEDVDSR